ncbi:hypothetical protein EDB89DRAFT_1651308 [Lactarius sanguifluus]|nr:hypothetical protein EDB89DRAFT_1651308 [Lactarius sanguifluus]
MATNRTGALVSHKLAQRCFVRQRYAHDPDFMLLPARPNFNILLFPMRVMMDQRGVALRDPYSRLSPHTPTPCLVHATSSLAIHRTGLGIATLSEPRSTSSPSNVGWSALHFSQVRDFAICESSSHPLVAVDHVTSGCARFQHVRHCARPCFLSVGIELACDTPLPSGMSLYTLPQLNITVAPEILKYECQPDTSHRRTIRAPLASCFVRDTGSFTEIHPQ